MKQDNAKDVKVKIKNKTKNSRENETGACPMNVGLTTLGEKVLICDTSTTTQDSRENQVFDSRPKRFI